EQCHSSSTRRTPQSPQSIRVQAPLSDALSAAAVLSQHAPTQNPTASLSVLGHRCNTHCNRSRRAHMRRSWTACVRGSQWAGAEDRRYLADHRWASDM
ncbi:unnamed protein product, partial [Tilletia caries]